MDEGVTVMEEDVRRLYDALREYDDGTLDAVMTRKLAEIAALESSVEAEGPSRDRMLTLRFLIEDTMLYNMVRQLITSSEEDFEGVLDDVRPAFDAELEDVPRSVIDGYRRGMTDDELLTEDRAMGYVDDIKGLVTGRCAY